MTSNPNSIPRVLLRFLANLTIAFSLPVLALLINPWLHGTAKVLFNAWVLILVVVAFAGKAPCHYDSYTSWWADRRNWFK